MRCKMVDFWFWIHFPPNCHDNAVFVYRWIEIIVSLHANSTFPFFCAGSSLPPEGSISYLVCLQIKFHRHPTFYGQIQFFGVLNDFRFCRKCRQAMVWAGPPGVRPNRISSMNHSAFKQGHFQICLVFRTWLSLEQIVLHMQTFPSRKLIA